jgi:hypothetical protein
MTISLEILAFGLCAIGIVATVVGKMAIDDERKAVARAASAGLVAVVSGLLSLLLIHQIYDALPIVAIVPGAVCIAGAYLGVRAAIIHARSEM